MKGYILAILAFCLLGLAACYDDNSVLATSESRINGIVINGLKDTSVIAFSSVLNITPIVEGYADSELSYAWYIYGGEFSKQIENGFRTVKIGDGKTLSYDVKLKQGNYTLVFEATSKDYSYSVTKEMKLEVFTPFSQGFYILKETAEGNTELDVYNLTSKKLEENVLSLVHGHALPGAPRCLNTVYGKAYVDTTTAKSRSMIMAFVAHGRNGLACFRTDDLQLIFDRSSLLFGDMSDDEVPYCMATTAMAHFYVSSKGVRTEKGLGGTYATGKLGFPAGNGGSTLVQACDGSSLLYWDGQNRRLMYVTEEGEVDEVRYLGNDFVWDDVEAVATGWNYLARVNTVWYLLEDNAGQRYLVFVDDGYNVTKVQRLDPTSHLNRGQIIAGNGKTSFSIYAVDNNVIYRHNMEDGSESEIMPEGLPTSGMITYFSNVYHSTAKFDYIVIGLQNGADYTLYMYGIVGGLPYGAPIHTVVAKGKLKDVRYVGGRIPFMPNLYPFYGMDNPDFPY